MKERRTPLTGCAPFVCPARKRKPVTHVHSCNSGASIRQLSIGVAYGSEPRQVQAVLLKLARDNSDVLKTPEPFVTLDEFAPASINFTLYAYIGDITQTGSVSHAAIDDDPHSVR
ncbi:MAG: hypothetical protein WAM72_23100 [Xanthobacteraceae bacterium]